MPRRYLLYASQNYSYAILRPLQAAIRARGDEVVWFLQGDSINADYLTPDEKRLHHIDEVVAYAPDASLVPGNMIPDFIPGLKVGVFHGFNVGKRNRRGQRDHFNIRGCFDLYCTQGPNTTMEFQSLAKLHGYFSVAETGWSAMDPLFIPDPLLHEKTIEKNAGENNKPVILMCSTFSRHLTCAPHLYDEVKKLSQNDKWRWLVQFHPKMSAEIVAQYKGLENDNLSFIETDNVIPLLQQADVMLCDTSSVLLMFMLQNKPVVTFNNGEPGPQLMNFTDPAGLEQQLMLALTRPTQLMATIKDFIDQLHPYQDGKSSERVLDAVESVLRGENRPRRKKPLNLLRNLKSRKALNYWKF